MKRLKAIDIRRSTDNSTFNAIYIYLNETDTYQKGDIIKNIKVDKSEYATSIWHLFHIEVKGKKIYFRPCELLVYKNNMCNNFKAYFISKYLKCQKTIRNWMVNQ